MTAPERRGDVITCREVEFPTPEAAFIRAAELADALADLANDYGDARLARVTTDALQLAQGLRHWCEFLATIAGAGAEP